MPEGSEGYQPAPEEEQKSAEESESEKSDQMLSMFKKEVSTCASAATGDVPYDVADAMLKNAEKLGLNWSENQWVSFIKQAKSLKAEDLGPEFQEGKSWFIKEGYLESDVWNGQRWAKVLPSYAEEKVLKGNSLVPEDRILTVDIDKLVKEPQTSNETQQETE